MEPILRLVGVSRSYGGLAALKNISFSLIEGETVGLIGPNGAGKTTLVNVVTGFHLPDSGSVYFEGKRINGKKPYQISRLGIARAFQIEQPFSEMSVLDNVAAGALFAGGAKNIKEAREAASEHLRSVDLLSHSNSMASALNLANRKRLELAKSLAMNARLLILDEVNAGLNPVEIDRALELISSLHTRGITVLLIEHLMKVVMSLCSRLIVLNHGIMIADGQPSEIVSNEGVIEAYLGKKFAKRLRGDNGHGKDVSGGIP